MKIDSYKSYQSPNFGSFKITATGKKYYNAYLANQTPARRELIEAAIRNVQRRQQDNQVPFLLIARNVFRVGDESFRSKLFSTFLGRLYKAEQKAILANNNLVNLASK